MWAVNDVCWDSCIQWVTLSPENAYENLNQDHNDQEKRFHTISNIKGRYFQNKIHNPINLSYFSFQVFVSHRAKGPFGKTMTLKYTQESGYILDTLAETELSQIFSMSSFFS